jgi:hypothetical protein
LESLAGHPLTIRIAHKTLGDAPLHLVGPTAAGLSNQALDFPLHVAVTGILCVIEDTAQNATEGFANSSHRCARGEF